MKVKFNSFFKNPEADKSFFESWALKLEENNKRTYERFQIPTSIGVTHVWGLNTTQNYSDTLVIFPGARTTSLIWDFDRGLDNLNHPLKIYMVETNGLPNLSDGGTPDIKSLDYGIWAKEVFEKLNIEKAFVTGASFGGLICMKLGIIAPEKIQAVFLLNPGCLQPFSLSWSNLYYNLLPIISPTEKNVLTFLEKAVFCKPIHCLSPFSEKMLVDYEVFALTRYKDNTQKPYFMGNQLKQVHVDTHLLVGDRDLLFPFKKSISNANQLLKKLNDVKVFNNVGHGIETYAPALNYVGNIIRNKNSTASS